MRTCLSGTPELSAACTPALHLCMLLHDYGNAKRAWHWVCHMFLAIEYCMNVEHDTEPI